RLTKFEKLAEEKKLGRDLIDEGQGLLKRMPKLEAQRNLRKAYQGLADGNLALDDFQKRRAAIIAQTKLSDREAGEYAVMVIRATRLVRANYVKDVNQGQLVDWAVRGLYQRLEQSVPTKIKDQLEKAKTLKEVDLMKVLAEARQHLGKREDLAKGKDITYALHVMLGRLDKHTDYIDPDTLSRTKNEITGQFTGIGVQIRNNPKSEMLQVVTPIKDSPAYKAKIFKDDIITKIIREVDSEGKPLEKPEVISTKGMTTEDAVKKITGKAGTKVKLLVQREGVDKPLEFELIRGSVEVESVLGYKRKKDDSWDYVIDKENKICYLRLMGFQRNSFRDMRKVMEQLAKEVGIKGFILDLRFNPGGLLDVAVNITD